MAGDSSCEDGNGHGTHVTGIAAGTTYGVAKKATIVPVRIYDSTNSGPLSAALDGINWVLGSLSSRGRRAVINMSFGGEKSSFLDNAVAALVSAGAPVFVAAGNEGGPASAISPASAPAAFCVGATDDNGAWATYTNRGPELALLAPGSAIVSSWVGTSTAFHTMSGTSMASPFAAGVAATLLQDRPGAPPQEVRSTLVCSATTGAISGVPPGTTSNLLFAPQQGWGGGGCVLSGVHKSGGGRAGAAHLGLAAGVVAAGALLG